MSAPDSIASAGIVDISTVEPVVSFDGLMWFNPDTAVLSIRVNGVWVPMGGGYHIVTSPPTDDDGNDGDVFFVVDE